MHVHSTWIRLAGSKIAGGRQWKGSREPPYKQRHMTECTEHRCIVQPIGMVASVGSHPALLMILLPLYYPSCSPWGPGPASPRLILWVNGRVSLCSRQCAVSQTPQLACSCTLFSPWPIGRGCQCGPQSTSTLRMARAPSLCRGGALGRAMGGGRGGLGGGGPGGSVAGGSRWSDLGGTCPQGQAWVKRGSIIDSPYPYLPLPDI